MAHALTRLHVEKYGDNTGWVLVSVNLSPWFRGFSHTQSSPDSCGEPRREGTSSAVSNYDIS